MEHFVLDLHYTILSTDLSDNSTYMAAGSLMVTDLPRGYHLCGFPHPGNCPHYAGNFWLAKCELINTLPRLESLDLSNRFTAEFWLGASA